MVPGAGRELQEMSSPTPPNSALQGSRGDPGDLGPRGDAGPPGPKVKSLNATRVFEGEYLCVVFLRRFLLQKFADLHMCLRNRKA